MHRADNYCTYVGRLIFPAITTGDTSTCLLRLTEEGRGETVISAGCYLDYLSALL